MDDKRIIVFDIETIGNRFEDYDHDTQKYFLKFVKNESEYEQAVLALNFSGFTGEIVCIALYDVRNKMKRVFYRADKEEIFESENKDLQYFALTNEAEILQKFWERVTEKKCQAIISFNGRAFDCPFIYIRSAKLKIQATRNLLPYRFDPGSHCDLMEQFSFYAATKKFSLDFITKFFDIESPKSKGVTGLDVGNLFTQKRFKEIAEYCMRDVEATAKLFEIWNEYLNPKKFIL